MRILFRIITAGILLLISQMFFAQKVEKNDTLIIEANDFYFECVVYSLILNIENSHLYQIENDKNSSISQHSANRYDIVFWGENRRSKITVRRKEDNEIVFSKVYNFKPLPITPFIEPNIVSGMSISKERFKSRKRKIRAGIVNYNVTTEYDVKSFTMICSKNDSIIKIRTRGNIINKEQVRTIESLSHGQPVIFMDIMIEKYNGVIQPVVSPIVLFVE